MSFTETNFENAIIELFQSHLGYNYIFGPKVERDYVQPLYLELLKTSLIEINRDSPIQAIDEAILKICSIEGGSP